MRILLDVTGSRLLKMAAAKPKVLISQLPDQIETPFQRLTYTFRDPATQWLYCEYCPMRPEVGFEDGGRQTGSTYISASRPGSDSVSTATHYFRGPANSMALLRILPDVTGSRFFKDGGSQTGRTFIPASRQDSSAVTAASLHVPGPKSHNGQCLK